MGHKMFCYICICCRVIRSSKQTYPTFPLCKTHPWTLTVTPALPPPPTPYTLHTSTGIRSPLRSLPLLYQLVRQAGAGGGCPWDQCTLPSGSYVSRGKTQAPRRPQTRREEGMEKIPCIPRPPGLQTHWGTCGEAGRAGLGPWDPIPKVLLLPSCLASVCLSLSLLMFSCLFEVSRRMRGDY